MKPAQRFTRLLSSRCVSLSSSTNRCITSSSSMCQAHILKQNTSRRPSLVSSCSPSPLCLSPFVSAPGRWFGQPAAQTHPHLLSSGEVTPNITKEEYHRRRCVLVDQARNRYPGLKDVEDHIMVFPSSQRVHMSNDIPYPFRQHTDFLYLSGFQEPESVLVIHSSKASSCSSDTNHTSILFVPQKDLYKELWEGARSGVKGAVELTGVDSAENSGQLEAFLSGFCRDHNKFVLWYDFTNPPQAKLHSDIMSQVIAQECHRVVESTQKLMHSVRVQKSAAEVELMKQTVQIASEAFVDVMKFSRPWVEESHLWAKMDFECRVRGAQYLAYPPVVAGGSRANTIHYTANNNVVGDGDLVLMDAGCELHGYTSDLTRTWPVNGKFSEAQRELYEAVLSVQIACIALSTTSHSLDDLFRQMLGLLGLQLQKLGMVPRDASASDIIKKARALCPHHVGHYLGMDVHDCSEVSRSTKLQPGMVITVEPGIYIQSDDTSVAEKYRGIGIRIEDNILITESTPINLSQHCPKTVEDIERVMCDRCYRS